MGRTKNSVINIIVSLGGQLLVLLASFVTRSVFIRVLSVDYLGINGLFSNILSMLSVMELGIGSAIVYSLYKPIANHQTDRIRALMSFYKRAYQVIGGVVTAVGLALLPFLHYFMKNVPDLDHIGLYYVLYLANTVLSFFFVYKRSLIIAHQKQYISVLYQDVFFLIRSVLQILLLVIWRSYFAYLAVQIVCTVVENLSISHKADRMFPYLKEKGTAKLDETLSSEIKKNTVAMVWHKLGTVVVLSTDNLLISKLVGVAETGLYSNYLIITNALNTLYGFVFNGVVASVGNLHATESTQKQHEVFLVLNLIGFWIYGFSAICLFYLLNPFIGLWLGNAYCFPDDIVFWIALNFYLYGMRRAALAFRNALGLYWYDRYKPIAECVINLGVSIWLGMVWGTAGILIGTAVSTMAVCFWIEPWVLYHYGFRKNAGEYFKKYGRYTLCEVGAALLVGFAVRAAPGMPVWSFLYKALVCTVVVHAVFLICFRKSKELKALLKMGGAWKRRKSTSS